MGHTKSAKTVDRFMKYAWNFAQTKIGSHYAPQCLEATTVPDHLAEKFQHFSIKENGNGTFALLRLWHELDYENQNLVVGWLEENYKG